MSETAPPLLGHRLHLFEAAATARFVPARTAALAGNARRIAESPKLALFLRRSELQATDLRNRPPLPASS